jgi:hypothetical protein
MYSIRSRGVIFIDSLPIWRAGSLEGGVSQNFTQIQVISAPLKKTITQFYRNVATPTLRSDSIS